MNPPAAPLPVDRAIEGHAAIGDRRTGALVAADGTLDWWCLPDFDGAPIFDALLGRVEEARRLLARCDAVAGGTGLLAEQIDPRQNHFLGNTPLLFTHGEYVRAAIAIHEASSP